jgi:large subunit ribosomal protein L28
VAANCDVCGKGPGFGNKVSRLGVRAMKRRVKSRTPRRFDPNIQRVRAVVNGATKRINVCAACLKAGKVARAA